jgi:hypothetical protein
MHNNRRRGSCGLAAVLVTLLQAPEYAASVQLERANYANAHRAASKRSSNLSLFRSGAEMVLGIDTAAPAEEAAAEPSGAGGGTTEVLAEELQWREVASETEVDVFGCKRNEMICPDTGDPAKPWDGDAMTLLEEGPLGAAETGKPATYSCVPISKRKKSEAGAAGAGDAADDAAWPFECAGCHGRQVASGQPGKQHCVTQAKEFARWFCGTNNPGSSSSGSNCHEFALDLEGCTENCLDMPGVDMFALAAKNPSVQAFGSCVLTPAVGQCPSVDCLGICGCSEAPNPPQKHPEGVGFGFF